MEDPPEGIDGFFRPGLLDLFSERTNRSPGMLLFPRIETGILADDFAGWLRTLSRREIRGIGQSPRGFHSFLHFTHKTRRREKSIDPLASLLRQVFLEEPHGPVVDLLQAD